MIEIKITIDSALGLLLDRMNLELKLRQRDRIIRASLRLEDLSYQELFLIVEASIFDTIFLLPIDLVAQETNLINIITGTVRALSRVLNRDEFKFFTSRQAAAIIQPIVNLFQSQSKLNDFRNN